MDKSPTQPPAPSKDKTQPPAPSKALNPSAASKWELFGVSAWPVVTALLAAGVHTRLGLTLEQFVEVLAGLMSLAAITRAGIAARKGASA